MTDTASAQPYIISVDDEEDLREPVAAYLRDQGLDVGEAGSGVELDTLLADRVPQGFVLDVTMPVEDGFSIAKRLRAAYGNGVGIVMLTARRDVIDRVVGLELGADDYIMKPFEPRELLARIRAVLRRLQEAPAAVAAPAQAPAGQAAQVDEDGYEIEPAEDASRFQHEFWIPTSRGQVRVPVDTIEWIEAAKAYALLHTAERSHMIRITMAQLEEALDPAQLVRVHRSAFVAPSSVLLINAIGRHMTLVLKSGASVRVGPRHWAEVRSRIKG